ncbi:hypothetical protein [Shewanella algae]|uniref:hypothetical protein n=1 Tax=Shewanella algae TaxID=38313 RepID=UPI0031F58992
MGISKPSQGCAKHQKDMAVLSFPQKDMAVLSFPYLFPIFFFRNNYLAIGLSKTEVARKVEISRSSVQRISKMQQ